MLPRPCLVCGEPSPESRCKAHKLRTHTKPRSRHERGYTSAWDRLSKQARRIQPWCSDCGATERLSVDHTPASWQKVAEGKALTLQDFADGLLSVRCLPCNIAAGHARGNNVTRDATG